MYKRVIDILDEYLSSSWFLDSGSLLGVVRDDEFLKCDRGIDISCICNNIDSNKLSKCVNELVKAGFIMSKYQWEGQTYKYCFVPQINNPCYYAFDLHLFYEFENEKYSCPQVSLHKDSNKLKSFFRSLKKGNPLLRTPGIMGSVKYIIGYMYRYYFVYFGSKVNMSRYAKKGSETYLWIIPKAMYHGTEKGYMNFNILKLPEEYLQFRYGNWRIPVKNWITTRDDGGLEKCTYDDISRFMCYKNRGNK